ncbi:MAG: Uma2 family endonuclease [Nitrospirota bacterium]
MKTAVLSRPPAGEIILTYDDYAAIPNDGKRYEIIEGDILMSPAPRPKHQKAIGNLYWVIRTYLEEHPIGEIYLSPIDVILSYTNVVQPDLLFLSEKKRHLVGERGIEGPPDLIVEVLSPTTEKTDRITKSNLYAKFGVSHYWLIDPETKQLEMFRLFRGHFRSLPPPKGKVTSDLFDGISFNLADLFR